MSDLLPPQSTPAERAIAASLARLDAVPVAIGTLWTPADCPAAFLPWLAWALSVDSWEPRWPEEVRRRVIAEAIEVHRAHGTIDGMRRALAALGVEVTIAEWWEYGGQPYTFRVVALPSIDLIGDPELPILSGEAQRQIRRLIEIVKPARAHFDLSFLLQIAADTAIAAAAVTGIGARIDGGTVQRAGAALHQGRAAAGQAALNAAIDARNTRQIGLASALNGRAGAGAAALHSLPETEPACRAPAAGTVPRAALCGATTHTIIETETVIHGS